VTHLALGVVEAALRFSVNLLQRRGATLQPHRSSRSRALLGEVTEWEQQEYFTLF
jgi:hypothetical protein